MENDWKHFNVHLVWPDMEEEKVTVTALSRDDALKDTRIKRAMDIGAYPHKVVGPLQHTQTYKQKMAGSYAWILGNLSSAEATMVRTKYTPDNSEFNDKIERAHALARSQFAKLRRDVRDLFKIAGLKVK